MTDTPSAGSASKRFGNSLPLERKLPLLILAILTLILATSLAISYYEVRRSAELSASERLSNLSRSLASMQLQQIGVRLANMRRAAADTAIQRAFSTPGRPLSAGAVKVLAAIPLAGDSLSAPLLLTTEGRVIGPLKLVEPSELERFRTRLPELVSSSDSEYVGALAAVAGQARLWYSVPVRKAGRVLGFLAHERRLGALPRAALQPFRDLVGAGITVYVRNAKDDVWVQVSGTVVPSPTRAAPFHGGLQLLTTDGQVALASTTPIGTTPIALTVEQPMDDILARPRAMIRVLMLLALILVGIGGVFAWIISREIVRPLSELTAAVEAMAQGEYSKRVSGSHGHEIGRLGSAFNRMAEQVEVASINSTRAVEQLTRSVGTQQFLADASRALATSLSDQNLLTDITRFCVPAIADYCSVHLVDDDGTVRRVETVHRDPAQLETVRALLARYQYRVDGQGEVPSVIRSQLPLVVPQVDLDRVVASAPDDAFRTLFKAVGPTSYLCVPLVARGRSVGAISLTMTDSGRTFTTSDVELAMELGRRTAVAVDNALIYRRSLSLRLEAEAASTAKSDFLAKMSHEFRTPINAMIGYAELLEMEIAGPVAPAQAKQLSRIRASGEHLTGLVNEILDFAKIESGSMRVEPSNGIASDAVDAALALIRPQAASKGVELDGKSVNGARVEYVGDPQRVQQVLTNLLSNAVKFTPTGGKIS